MDEITETPGPVKKFVRKHKTAITVALTSIAWIAINKRTMNQYDDFLKEKGLYEEFWTSEEEK